MLCWDGYVFDRLGAGLSWLRGCLRGLLHAACTSSQRLIVCRTGARAARRYESTTRLLFTELPIATARLAPPPTALRHRMAIRDHMASATASTTQPPPGYQHPYRSGSHTYRTFRHRAITIRREWQPQQGQFHHQAQWRGRRHPSQHRGTRQPVPLTVQQPEPNQEPTPEPAPARISAGAGAGAGARPEQEPEQSRCWSGQSINRSRPMQQHLPRLPAQRTGPQPAEQQRG